MSAGAVADNLRGLTLRDGLAGMSVTRMAEDPTGKMWLATSNGVSLYNGQSFKNYTLPRQKNGLPNPCHDIALDHNGNVWVATKAGVFYLRRRKEEFQQVAPEVTLAECVLCVGDTTYVGCRSGLYAITANGQAKSIDISAGRLRGNNSVRCLRQHKGYLWLTVRTGLIRMELKTRRMKFYQLDTPSGLSRFDLLGDSLYIGTKNNGIYRMSIKSGQSESVNATFNVVNDVIASPDGLLCIATDGYGACLIDSKTGTVVKHFSANPQSGQQLPINVAYTYLRSRDGIDWVGLLQSGMAHGNSAYQIFTPYECGTFSSRNIKARCSLTDGHIRLIAVNGGIWLVDEQAQTSQYYDTRPWKTLNINMLYQHGDAYYIGSFDGGLLRFDKATRQLSRLADYPQLSYASISDITTAPDGRMWVASSEGLFVVDNGRVARNYTEKNSRLPMGVTSIRFDRKGNAWIGSSRGTCLYLPQEDDFKVDNFPQGFFNTIPGLHYVSRGDTLFAYTDTQLYYTDADMTRFGEIPVPTSVLEEKCYGFLPDANGILYMVTEKGFFRMDNNDRSMIHLSHSEGLLGSIIYIGSLGMNERQLWVGTNEGLMIADKQSFSHKAIAAVRLSMEIDYLFNGDQPQPKSVLMDINDQHVIRADWNLLQRRLTLSPAFLDFAQHDGEIYEYRIDQGAWQSQQVGNPMRVKGLWPGRHTLEIRLSGMESTLTHYSIYVYPTTLFYLEVILLLTSLGLFLWWFRWRKATKLVIKEHEQTEQALLEEIKILDRQKYQNSRTDDKELARIFRQMDDYVKTNKPYLNKDSKMSEIASALGVSPSMLSQVFTLYAKEPYYDYINKYRLAEFKRLIDEGQHKQFTIQALYEQCGFKKTSFFTAFRKLEGMTPTEYLQKAKK